MSDERSETPRSAAAEKGQLQTLHRALDLLEVLAEAGQVTLSGLSEQLGLARTTTHRLLTTLTTRGYIRQDPMTGHYSVGIRTFVVGSAFVAQNQVRDLARPFLRELNQQFNETISLAVLDGDEAVYVDVVDSKQTLRTFARVGARVPLYCTGVGKALLTGFGATELARYTGTHPLRPFTPSTITSADALRGEIRRAQETGYVLDREEYTAGVRCGAAPMRNHAGQTVAALSFSGPAYRIVGKFWTVTAGAVAAAAQELSRSLGFYAEPPGGRRTGRPSH